ncbi:putative secondary metabolism biosynthetic enzyme [Alternaria metachromatica]|uniref:putative secondary metabolism biosynthetic enzyme n=1 Tax=Alternaria metachromatica TaxID=283354 RepID=UPI0020C3B1AC|nr:putative secondary metabolism biosynthetic enzyme [Alternaria metachromatica]KAI4608132.1 putative secondary metabolism biosynthetic enzyme [Alternaria metachromatica]
MSPFSALFSCFKSGSSNTDRSTSKKTSNSSTPSDKFSTMAGTTYLITGAARGLGKAMVETYLARPNNTVIAVARTTSSAESLKSLPAGKDSKLIVIAYDSRDAEGPKKAIEELKSQGITTIDTVIANAGVSSDYAPVASVSLDVLKSHVEVNAYGPLLLFQAVLPLLLKSSNPKFAALGTPIASITGMESRPFPMAAYGMSKVMLHWMVCKAHFDHPELTAFVLDPGFVQTDMGNEGAKTFGMEKAFITVEDSANFLVSTIDKATREATSGHFPTIEGGDFKW